METFFTPASHEYGLKYALANDGRLYFHFIDTEDVYSPLINKDMELFASTYTEIAN